MVASESLAVVSRTEAIAKAIEDTNSDQGIEADRGEAIVSAEFTVVFERPSIQAVIVGVLQNFDLVVVQNKQTANKFARICAGSWVRDKSDRTSLYKLKKDAWILNSLPKRPNEQVVQKLPPPRSLLCFEVVADCVVERSYPSSEGEMMKVWRRGQTVEAVDEFPGGYLRTASQGDNRGQSGFVHRGWSEGRTLVYRYTKAIESGSRQENVQPQPPKSLGSAALAAAFAPVEEGKPSPFEPDLDTTSMKPSINFDPPVRKRPAAYFGIVDLKYDNRATEKHRLKVLELGSGRSSRFSGYGEDILNNYQRNYTLVKQLDRAVMVDNKKMTHDVFEECGFGHLRPHQACFPRVYSPELHSMVENQLWCSADDSVVLKLVNRCRGAGVVLARVGQELDEVLKRLLCPLAIDDDAISLDAVLTADSSSLDEQCMHWWSNECPFFVAERCESSHPIQHGGDVFDGTLRVGFVLLRGEQKELQFGIEFLGGYWKLPSAPVGSTDIRARCVSKARTGTAPVDTHDLEEIENILRKVLPEVFATERAGTASLIRRYSRNPMLFSFAMARHGASQLQREMQEQARQQAQQLNVEARALPSQQTERLFNMASDRVNDVPSGAPRDASASHVERQLGAAAAAAGDWKNALKRWRHSLELYPWNATSEHLVGYYFFQESQWLLAERSFVRSMCLDPDFKASYANLSAVYLALDNYPKAQKVAQAGLKRHPYTFQCSYNLGIANAAILSQEVTAGASQESLSALVRASCTALIAARDQKESTKSDWSQNDDELLRTLEELGEHLKTNRSSSAAVGMTHGLLGHTGWHIRNFRP
mmetsp:Transcript_71075/g.123271  ORF Transcript_71075/g.123271 Transcript_71075/m.123271 type:complete len:820 (+) Transcript_71075:106-2565(+)